MHGNPVADYTPARIYLRNIEVDLLTHAGMPLQRGHTFKNSSWVGKLIFDENQLYDCALRNFIQIYLVD